MPPLLADSHNDEEFKTPQVNELSGKIHRSAVQQMLDHYTRKVKGNQILHNNEEADEQNDSLSDKGDDSLEDSEPPDEIQNNAEDLMDPEEKIIDMDRFEEGCEDEDEDSADCIEEDELNEFGATSPVGIGGIGGFKDEEG